MVRRFTLAQCVSTVVLLAVEANGAPDICCDRLTAALSAKKVFKASSPNYTIENQKYWSATAVLTPACVVVPESSSDVSTTLKTLTKNNCKFGIRGGGHTANPGWAGTNSGVLISLSKLNKIQVSEDKASVVIGAGNRWGDVYAKTGEHNVTVTGGRVSTVGVSGFLLGGGLSFLMQKEGFAANSIVLANGTVATITAESAGDLFKALKGGSGNFGIATSFTLQTYPVNNVYAGSLAYSPDQYDTLFPIMETYARKGVEDDPKTHVISVFGYVPSQAIDIASFYLLYSDPVTAPPPAIKPFFDVPTLANTVKVKTVKEAADELGTGSVDGLRQDMRAFSIRANAGLYKELLDVWHSTAVSQNSTAGCEEKGGNVLGLEPSSEPLVSINYQFSWTQSADDKKVYAAIDKLIATSMNIAKSQNRLAQYIYLNYASSNQKPLESYGPAQLDFLRKVKAKYDPHGVFEKLSRGGFKIPS
ncbi:unnamed protein product [Rhizoctonia solani]|uniref:FAD-binding PCMH-type domain-containing protein n=1 Tax=Rhizoctonia solani TaxID=456999 RepID=A0A8H3DZV9_9AGAM|nr:unnamed protein product [Rhizoctonia solani]